MKHTQKKTHRLDTKSVLSKIGRTKKKHGLSIHIVNITNKVMSASALSINSWYYYCSRQQIQLKCSDEKANNRFNQLESQQNFLFFRHSLAQSCLIFPYRTLYLFETRKKNEQTNENIQTQNTYTHKRSLHRLISVHFDIFVLISLNITSTTTIFQYYRI